MKSTFIPKACTRRGFLQGAVMAGAALACQSPTKLFASTGTVQQTRLLMGTVVSICAVQTADMRAEEAVEKAFSRMSALEQLLSRHDSASPVAELNRTGSLKDAPAVLCEMVDRAQRYNSLTSGAFDVTVTPVLELFKARQNPGGSMSLDAAAVRDALQLVKASALRHDGDKLWLERSGMAVTLDGIAKGYIVDEAVRVLHECGVHDHLINAGGDILASGQKAPYTPWMVGLEDPSHQGRVLQTLPLRQGIATSGSYQVFFDASREHHHLINPLSGVSPTKVRSVSVTAPTVMQADALATALSIMIPQDALRLVQSLPGVECAIVRSHGPVLTSAGWQGKA